ncbi:MAG TPA: hypothetical protein VGL91_08445 [Acidobacteriota bacterium]|jgi:hypothetical protein
MNESSERDFGYHLAKKLPFDIIWIPALITLAVTVVRLLGELKHWSPVLFNSKPGGFGALVGIAWLAPIFGIYFAVKLAKAGHAPVSAGKAIGIAVLALVAFIGVGALGALFPKAFQAQLLFMALASVIAILISLYAWPALGKILLAYGLAARIPVAIVMLFAILGNWGTHYDLAPPEFPAMDPWLKFLWIGLLPQLTLWIAYTVVIGAIFGGIAVAIAGRRSAAPATA